MGWSGFPLLPFRHGCVSVHETFGARRVYAFRVDASLYVVSELPMCVSVRPPVFLLGCLRKSLVIYNEIRPISVFIHLDQSVMRQNSVIHCEFRLHMAPQLSPFTMSFANLCVSPWWACSDDSSRSGEQPLLPEQSRFLFRAARKKYSFSKRISGRKALNIFHWDLILHSAEVCKRTISSCQGKKAGRHVPFVRLMP